MKRSTPLKPSAFKRKPGASFSSFRSATKELERKPMKKRASKKPTVAEGSKYLEACRGEQCYLRVVCGGEASPDIVVPCHSNQSRDGKGMGLKASHSRTVPGCHWCHQWLDQGKAPREEKFAAWDRAYELWEPARAIKMGTAQPQMETA
jgi:hypothetical protein